MKTKHKPVAKADIRQRVERKFIARGAVAFHWLVILVAGILLLYNLPELWLGRRSNLFTDYAVVFTLLSGAGGLHFIRYHFRHGRGRDRHERETEERIAGQVRRGADDEAEEREELIRLQMGDKLKNRRALWQHATIYAAIILMMIILHVRWLWIYEIFDWSSWAEIATVAGLWGIGLAAHCLRYASAYGFSAARREAKIEAQVEREMRLLEKRRGARAEAVDEAEADGLTLEDMELAQRQPTRLPMARSKGDG